MALATVASVLNGIAGDSATMRLITANAINQSRISLLKTPAALTSPVVRGVGITDMVAAAVAEGGTKPITDLPTVTVNYQTQAVVLLVPMSTQLYQGETDMQEAVVKKLTSAISRGIDREILLNPNSVFATSIVAAASGVSNVYTTTASGGLYSDLSATFSLVEANGFTPNGVIMRTAEYGAIRGARDTNGQPLFSPALEGNAGFVFGVPSYAVDNHVLPNTAATGEARFIVGDWNTLEWGTFGNVEIKVSDVAIDAFQKNLVYVRAEVMLGFAVPVPTAFAVLKEA